MPKAPPVHRPFSQTKRGVSSTKRLRGRKLQKRSARLYMKNPLCVACQMLGRVKQATEWDHIIPLWEGGIDHESNLQGLCHSCHATKTAEEQRRRRCNT